MLVSVLLLLLLLLSLRCLPLLLCCVTLRCVVLPPHRSDGRMIQDKTCRAITKDNQFQYRLNCKQDCNNAWTCQQPNFDKSKCASTTTPVVTFVNLGQKCGYVQDNKQYACGGNHVSCINGVCVSSIPGK
jgi:hypothetical protein